MSEGNCPPGGGELVLHLVVHPGYIRMCD